MISRFDGADRPDWAAPSVGELREHFADGYLNQVTTGKIVETLPRIAARLREELVITQDDPLHARARPAARSWKPTRSPAPRTS